MESAGYYDLPKFGILGLLNALIPKIYLIGWDFCSLRDTSFVTATFHLGTITKIYARRKVAVSERRALLEPSGCFVIPTLFPVPDTFYITFR